MQDEELIFMKCINKFFSPHPHFPQQAKWEKQTKYCKLDQAKDIRNAARGTPKNDPLSNNVKGFEWHCCPILIWP